MNGIELFEGIKQVSTFAELLQSVNGKTKAETHSKRGNVFEKVWDIIIKFGFYSILPNDIYPGSASVSTLLFSHSNISDKSLIK